MVSCFWEVLVKVFLAYASRGRYLPTGGKKGMRSVCLCHCHLWKWLEQYAVELSVAGYLSKVNIHTRIKAKTFVRWPHCATVSVCHFVCWTYAVWVECYAHVWCANIDLTPLLVCSDLLSYAQSRHRQSSGGCMPLFSSGNMSLHGSALWPIWPQTQPT